MSAFQARLWWDSLSDEEQIEIGSKHMGVDVTGIFNPSDQFILAMYTVESENE